MQYKSPGAMVITPGYTRGIIYWTFAPVTIMRNRGKIFFEIHVPALLALALFLLGTIQLHAQPHIAVMQGLTIDIGEVKEGTILSKNLTIASAGTKTLLIKSVTASCGCTTTKISKLKLPAADTTSLLVTIDTKGFKGRLKKQIYIESNDPTGKILTVDLFLTVHTILEYEPSFVNFRDVLLGQSISDTILVRNTSETDITIVSVESPEPQISLEILTHTIPAGRAGKLIATINPEKKGKVIGQFTLKTNIRNNSVPKLSFIGHIQ